MDLSLNTVFPRIMHIDLNSCFATIEQQANPFIRGKPVCVAAYTTPGGCIISPSIEAKTIGVKLGMRVWQAKNICPRIVILPPDPPKYRDVHRKFIRLFKTYSPNVYPKSIDEAVIDFKGLKLTATMLAIGAEIKLRLKKEIGEWIRASVGIGPNRFLAKLAASIKKPDGLLEISADNLIDIYKQTVLTDFCGINTKLKLRLNAYGIMTPVDFLNAKLYVLQHQVFKSVVGFYWYLRVRGWEIDNVSFTRKSFGQSYALSQPTADLQELGRLIMKLCEKMARRLRGANFGAYGMHVAVLYQDFAFWHRGRKFNQPLYATADFYKKACLLLKENSLSKKVSHLWINCFAFFPTKPLQLELFASPFTQKKRLTDALDRINNRFGEYVIVPASMMNMSGQVIDRIAFGSVIDRDNS